MPNVPMAYEGAMPLLLRDSKWAGREISRMGAHTQTRLAGIDNETDVTDAKLDSNDRVTARAMMGVARVGQLEVQLATMAPTASGRLALLADQHTFDTAALKDGHVRRLQRR
jgi:hypothetical protein